jgi:hypothetical protein
VEVQLHAFLTSTLGVGDIELQVPYRISHKKGAPGIPVAQEAGWASMVSLGVIRKN